MPTSTRKARIEVVLTKRQKGLTLVLEDVHDPHNAAASMRTAEALGVGDIWVIYEKERYVNLRRVGKHSSSSANKWLSIRFFRSTRACYNALRKKGYTIYGTVLHKEKAKDLFAHAFRAPKVALVFGNEHRGLSPFAVTHADQLLTIPMHGFVESLNLSVSSAIFLFEIIRQRMASGKRTFLSQKERGTLLKELLKR